MTSYATVGWNVSVALLKELFQDVKALVSHEKNSLAVEDFDEISCDRYYLFILIKLHNITFMIMSTFVFMEGSGT